MRPNIHGIRAHLAQWGARLAELRGVRVECLEAAMWGSALFMFFLFALHVPFAVLMYLRREMPSAGWEVVTLSLFLLSFLGYVEDKMWMRRCGGFFSMFFWLVSGVSLRHYAPYAACLHFILFFCWGWVWTRVGKEAVKLRVWSELAATDTEARIVKMPKRA